MKTIKLPCFNIEVEFEENDYDSGTISSSLKEDDTIEDIVAYEPFNAAMEGIESIILAHALAGIDIETPAYLEGIETAVDACVNNI